MLLAFILLPWMQSCSRGSGGKSSSPVVPEEGPGAVGTPASPKAPLLLTRSTISRHELLLQLGNAFGAELQQLRQALYDLSASLAASCQSLDLYEQRAVQERWAKVMLIWERMEFLQFGPLAENRGRLRQEFYNWPEPLQSCAIDRQLLTMAQRLGTFYLPRRADRKGLQALEYLLYDEKLELSCSLPRWQKQIWERLSDTRKRGLRCAYAKAVVSELIQQTERIQLTWGPSDRHAFVAADLDPEAEERQLQQVFKRLFFLEEEARRLKLAAPAGFDPKRCRRAPEPCPEQEEFQRSQLSAEALRANIDGFQTLMLGPLVGRRFAGGFTALLRAEGGGEVADQLEDKVLKLTQLAHGTDKSLRELIADHYGEPCELREYDSWVCRMDRDMQDIVRLIASDMAPVFDWEVPRSLSSP